MVEEPLVREARLIDADPLGAAARLIARALVPRPLSAEALFRIQQSLLAQASPPRRRGRLVVRWAVVGSLLVTGVAGATTFAQRVLLPRWRTNIVPLFAPHSGPHAHMGGSVARPAPVVSIIEPLPAPTSSTTAMAPPVVDHTRAEMRHPVRIARAEPAVIPHAASTLSAESELLDAAIRQIRQGQNGAAALRLLDDYRNRFPAGQLSHEADRTRVEALLVAGQPRPALQLLDAFVLGRSPADRELRLVRGELRAESHRCGEAVADFSAVLAGPAPVRERALYGRASCLSREGDGAGARADLQELVAQFPSGKFASDARRALGMK